MTADTETSKLQVKSEAVRDFVLCTECTEPRCFLSAKKLSDEQATQLAMALEDEQYVCGGPLFEEGHLLVSVVGARADITCSTPLSPHYFSSKRAFSPVCYSCGRKSPCEIGADMLQQHQTVHPVCAACLEKGVQHRTRGKWMMPK